MMVDRTYCIVIPMISKSPRESAPIISTQSEPVDPPASLVEPWLDKIGDSWPKKVKKIRKADPVVKFRRQSIKQLCYGLDADLLGWLAPLVKHVSAKPTGEQTFQQLADLTESAAASCQGFFGLETESSTDEVDDALANGMTSLAGISSLLVAVRLRDVVLQGSDQDFERIVRSFLSLHRLALESQVSSPLLHQWLAIELPLTMASQLMAIKPFKKEGKLAAKRFVAETRQLLDSDGWPGEACLGQFAALAASWTRCVNLAAACGFKLGSSFLAQMEWVAEQFVRLHGPQKQLLFASKAGLPSKKSFVDFVMRLDGGGRAAQLARATGLSKSSGGKSKTSSVNPSSVSEWAQSAILKSSWKANSPLVGIDFSSTQCRLEVAAKQNLISGVCGVEVKDDGQLIDFGQSGFDVVCQLINDDVAYLELEAQYSGYKFYRQLLLAKNERFLFLADSVLKNGAGEIDYRLRMPLAKDINVIRENGTRELYLNFPGKGIQSLVLPLDLPEWTAERCRGLLSAEKDDRLGCQVLNLERTVELSSDGGALYCPLFIDLDPSRSRLKRTWRPLTVAQNLEILSSRVAAGYRVQVDEDQFVFYRALQSIGNRTFMGRNFSGDFFAAKFFRDGSVKEMIAVE